MTFDIGRVELDEVTTQSFGTQSLRVSADIFPTTGTQQERIDAAKQTRDNLLAIAGRIEPVSWSEDPTIDGWYRLVSASCDATPVALSSGVWNADLELERLPLHRTALIEATMLGANRTGPGGISHEAWYAIPSAHNGYDAAVATFGAFTRTGADSTSVTMIIPAAEADYYSASNFPVWRVDADKFYGSSVVTKFDALTVCGRQSTDVPTDWTVENGLIKVGISTGANTFTVTPASTSAYVASFALDIGVWNGSSVTVLDPDQFVSSEILEETSERCVTRHSHASSGLGLVTIDVALRRGSLFAEIFCSSRTARSWAIQQAAMTSDYSANVLQSADINGNRHLLFADSTVTLALSDTVMYLTTAAKRQRFGVGINQGAADTDPNGRDDLQNQWFATQAVLERVAGAAS